MAAVKVAARSARHQTTRPFLDQDARIEQDRAFDADAARILFDAVCTLRGTALKATQVLAMEGGLLPETYHRELMKACSQVRPMNRALALTIVRRELGRPDDVFDSFETVPFAAASLGQVHAATAEGGRPLAVKIQYPGVAEAVKTDLALLETLLTPTKYHRIFVSCFPVVARRLEEELDYRHEARETAFFGEHLPRDRFVVPVVDLARSTERILTTDRIAGLHLEPWLETRPRREARNRAGQLLVDFFHHSVYRLGVVHADPNPGNFLFRDDGRLGIVDFGCVERLTPAALEAASALTHGGSLPQEALERRLHASVGVHYRPDSNPAHLDAFLLAWGAWLREPRSSDEYDFSLHQDYFERGEALVKVFYEHVHHFDPGFLYFARTTYGLMRLLGRLGAKVRMNPLAI
jgi:predicted unusual protein kinase regulating ubiquinone biosynthesis (AarF/ABC1/UbiB family)